MIVLNVTYKCKDGMRDAFYASIAAEGIDAACRAEEGNIQYDYFYPADGRSDLFLVEKWRDADALAAHGSRPHMERLRALKAAYVDDTIIEKLEPKSC